MADPYAEFGGQVAQAPQAAPDPYAEFSDDKRPLRGALESFASKAAESVPVLGSLYNKGVAGLDAAGELFTKPASGTTYNPNGVQDAFSKAYKEKLAEQEALMAQRAKDQPVATTAGAIAGPIAGFGVLPAASMAEVPAAMATAGAVGAADAAARGGDSKDIITSGLINAAGGGAGTAAAKLIGKAGSGLLANWADRAAEQATGATTKGGLQSLRGVVKNLNLEPGELAQMLREQGIVGGMKGLSGVAEGAEAAAERTDALRRGLVKAADETGTKLSVPTVLAALEEGTGHLTSGIGKSDIAEAIANNAKSTITEAGGKAGEISHGELQDFLGHLNKQVSQIRKRLNNPNNAPSERDEALLATYNSLRNAQDEGLGEIAEGAGEASRQLRRLQAVQLSTEKIANNRELGLQGSHPFGLIGSTELSAAAMLAANHPVEAAVLASHALLGKATAPYRANILTSALSGAAQPAAKWVGRSSMLPLASAAGVQAYTQDDANEAKRKNELKNMVQNPDQYIAGSK